MAVQLIEHNQRACVFAEAMLGTAGKVAVIHPTGIRKIHIEFWLVEAHRDWNFIWLSPFGVYLPNPERIPSAVWLEIFPGAGAVFYYAELIQLSPTQIGALEVDCVILDEFHRCGAERLLECVHSLFHANPGAKMLGLSATNIRYLDKQRDIAQELFDGCIASEMTLEEAIVWGIFPEPNM